jgi:UDP-N-acetylmuramoyl-L-alanyl-D-glutamate--2,6-diaminopimelate ligase
MQEYGRAKLRLFATEGLRHAVVNIDDDFAPRVLAATGTSAHVLTCSTSGARADVSVRNARFHTGGVEGELHTPWGDGHFASPLPGAFNLANLAAAVTAVVLTGAGLRPVLQAVSQLQPVPGRMQVIPNALGVQVIVDYAHTPDALAQVLAALKAHVRGRLVTVFGCGGDRDRAKRQVMGRVACELSDRVVVTSDNPRSEDPAAILADIATGCSGEFVLVVDRAEAIALAIAGASAGDCVVIAGKGHEDYQIIEGERRRFSDQEQAQLALDGRAAQ